MNQLIFVIHFVNMQDIVTNLHNEEVSNQPQDIAERIEELDERDQLIAFLKLKKDIKGAVFSYLSSGTRNDLLERLGSDRAAEILETMAPDDRTEIFEDFPDTLIKEVINKLSPEQKRVALKLLGYPEDSIARLMTPYYVQAKKDWTVAKTFEKIKHFGKKAETLNFVYIVDEEKRLIDDVRIGNLLMCEPEDKLESIMDYRFIGLNTHMHKEDAIHSFDKYDRAALPVTTDDGVLVGIVTFDDILDEIEKRDTEDIQKLGGTEALDLSYTETPLFTLVQKRATWLIILFVGELLTATAMGYFEHEIAKAVVLALFIPLIISSGGNSGSQAATLIVRALAIKELSVSDWFYVIRKEILSGLILGAILGTVGLFRILLWQELSFFDYGAFSTELAFVVFFSLIGVVLWGTVTGAMIPILLKRTGVDPATSSAPFVATLVDVTGIVIYFSIAALFLSGKLL